MSGTILVPLAIAACPCGANFDAEEFQALEVVNDDHESKRIVSRCSSCGVSLQPSATSDVARLREGGR